jgi:hypothetical protein
MIWQCSDCNQIGFFWDEKPEDVIAKHRKECPIDDVYKQPTRWPNAGEEYGAEL